MRHIRVAVGAFALALAVMGLMFAQQGPQGAAKGKDGKGGGNGLIRSLADVTKELKGKLEKVSVHGKSLENNLEKDSADRDVFIYLPPSYATDTNRRYPVVYLLHGYGLTAERWVGFYNVAAVEKEMQSGAVKEMILVNPDAFTLFNGAMYSNSATTGYWEDFIAEDLVAYVDSHYRTMADRGGRGLAGHSMGGFGTFKIGMKRPDVFSNLYPMSACCLSPNLNPQSQQYSQAEAIKTVDEAKGNRGLMTTFASAAAWSPNPKNPPFYFDLPVKSGQLQPAIAAKWYANAPLAMVEQNVPNLRKYKAISIDVGLQDGLLTSNQQISATLTQAGIAHSFSTYEGDHNNRVAERMAKHVMPFFSEQLSFGSSKH
jgi:S-formylglutathione hydrolase